MPSLVNSNSAADVVEKGTTGGGRLYASAAFVRINPEWLQRKNSTVNASGVTVVAAIDVSNYFKQRDDE